MTDETPEVYLSRAQLLADLDRWPEAEQELIQARALAPLNVEILVLSAVVAMFDDRVSMAADFAEAATSVQPLHEGALITRAWVLVTLDDPDMALAFARGLAENYPNQAYPNLVAAAVFSVVGGGQLALDTAWSAARLAPEDPDAQWLLARIAARMELEDLTHEALDKARQFSPLPGRRTGVWKLWWKRYGGVDVAPPTTGSFWWPVIRIAAGVVVVGLLIAWLVAVL